MAIGNYTNVTLDNITSITNSTTISEWFVRANHTMYDGWGFFIMLFVLWFIVIVALQRQEDQPLTNTLYSSIFLSIISLMFRAVFIVENGIVKGMITDFQLYVFPLLAGLSALVLWMSKQS